MVLDPKSFSIPNAALETKFRFQNFRIRNLVDKSFGTEISVPKLLETKFRLQNFWKRNFGSKTFVNQISLQKRPMVATMEFFRAFSQLKGLLVVLSDFIVLYVMQC